MCRTRSPVSSRRITWRPLQKPSYRRPWSNLGNKLLNEAVDLVVALEQTVSEESALFVVESFELTWVHQETFEAKVHKLEILVERFGILNDRLVEL